mgnify:CR=1 FL=1
MLHTKTKTGVPVTLTGVEYLGRPVVQVELDHPNLGSVSMLSDRYGEMQGQRGIIGTMHTTQKSMRACITVTKAEFESALAEAKDIGFREIAELKSGAKKIHLHYHDGEYLSGYSPSGRAGELLIELGVAKEVSSWGTHVNADLVSALGMEFTYSQAVEFARPALEVKQEKKSVAAHEHEAKFTEANRTGTPVVLRH